MDLLAPFRRIPDRARKIAAAMATTLAPAAPKGPPVGTMQGAPVRWGFARSTTSVSGKSRNLTTAMVADYLRQADMGNPAAFAQLCEEVEDRDLHILSVMGVRKRAVANLPWKLVPAGDSQIDRLVAVEAEKAIRAITNLEQGYLDLLDAIMKGFAASEIEWAIQRGRVNPIKLHYRKQQWLRPDLDDPEKWRVLDAADPVFGVPLLPNKWAVHVVRSKSGFPVQGGLGRPILWWYLFKNYFVKDWVSYSEKYGSPFRIGKFPSTADDKDIDLLDEAVQRLGIDASAIIPEEMNIEFKADTGAKTGGDTYERALLYSDRQISKGVLGQTLTTEEGSSGTQALGNVHNNVRADLRNSDALELSRTLTRDVITPWVLWNYGPNVAPPQHQFDTEPPADKKADAETQVARGNVFKVAIELGLEVPESQMREELNIRELEANEGAVKTPTTTPGSEVPAAPASVQDTAFNGAQIASYLQILQAIKDGALTKDAAVALIKIAYPTVSEEEAWATVGGRNTLAAGVRILGAAVGETSTPADQLTAVVREFRTQIIQAWRDIIKQLRAELGDVVEVETLRARIPAVLAKLDLAPYASQVARSTLAGEALGRLQVLYGDPARRPALPTTDPLEDVAGWAKVLRIDEPTWAARVGYHGRQATEAVRAAILRQAQDILDQVLSGAPPEKAWDAAEKGGRQGQAAEDLAAQKWNEGRWEGISARKDRIYLRYNTMQDNRVRPTHQQMEGRVYPATHPIWQVWRPPNGYGCRCWVTAHTYEEVQAAGWKITEDYPEDSATGLPALPDDGWRSAQRGQGPDLSEFPQEWKDAVGVPK